MKLTSVFVLVAGLAFCVLSATIAQTDDDGSTLLLIVPAATGRQLGFRRPFIGGIGRPGFIGGGSIGGGFVGGGSIGGGFDGGGSIGGGFGGGGAIGGGRRCGIFFCRFNEQCVVRRRGFVCVPRFFG